MLALINVPVGPTQSSEAQHNMLERRYQEWQRDNIVRIPPSSEMREFQISGVYGNSDDSIRVVYNRAFQDIHLTFGMDMVPQSPADAKREHARKFIRNRPDLVIRQNILDYKQCLMTLYTSADLMTTEQICEHDRWLKMACFKLVGTGYVDERGLVTAIGSLSAILGDVVNGWKEYWVDDDPWVTAEDLVIFRVNSIYLFWCADWLARYLTHPQEGPAIISGPQRGDCEFGKQKTVQMAKLPLRNWVAWSLFVESLPKGAFRVPAPKDLAL